ncbi:MAG: hypothetical protein AB1384_13910 [Actinomycetota bacterium]
MDAQVGSAPLTVEQMRDIISSLVQGINASDPGELARELFRDDGEFASDLIASVPRLVSAASQTIKAFAESVEGMTPEKGAELVAGAHARISGAEFAEAVNAVSRLIIRIHEQNPELLPEAKVETMADFMLATDFGKLRKAVTYRANERLDLLRREVEVLGDNPMALINIFSVVAPVVNDLLPVLKAVFDILALPAEAVTYALFKILQDIEWQDFAAIINGAAAFIVNVHRGSMILGDGSLYTRGPFQRISSELVSALDGQVLAEAIVAIGEEGEAFSTALANKVMEDESLMMPLLEAVVFVANSSFRAAASILEKANDLPRETLSKMVAAVAEDLEVGELGRTLTSLATFNHRIIVENPELIAGLSRQTVTALGLDASPEAAASWLNRALASYNGWVDRNPGLVAKNVGGFLAEVDTRELERAARATGNQLADALSRNPAVIKPLMKAAISVLGTSIKGYVKGLVAARKARG